MDINIEVSKVASVYSGRAGACCCGCAGKHSYASQHREWASKHRGYKVEDADISDRSVKLIVGKLKKAVAEGAALDLNDEYLSAEQGNRLYVVYLVH